jgi:hypothetical protein
MEKITKEAVDKAVEMLTELGVSPETCDKVKAELTDKVGKEDAAEPAAEPAEIEDEAAEAPKKGNPFTAFGGGKNSL